MSQTGLWGQLGLALQKERDAYQQLFTLLAEELSALKNMNHLSLADLNHHKESTLQIISQCEHERSALLRKLVDPSFKGNLLEWLWESSAPQAAVVKPMLRDLVTIGKQVKQIGENNSGLTVRALHVVREAIGMIHRGLGSQPVYGESGQLKFPSMTTSLNLQG